MGNRQSLKDCLRFILITRSLPAHNPLTTRSQPAHNPLSRRAVDDAEAILVAIIYSADQKQVHRYYYKELCDT